MNFTIAGSSTHFSFEASGIHKIPVRFEDVRIVVVNQLGGDQRRLPGIDTGGKAPLQHGSFIPRHRMQRKITDAGALSRKRELLQHGKSVRQHFRDQKNQRTKGLDKVDRTR